jgi:transcription elongation factor Elf1
MTFRSFSHRQRREVDLPIPVLVTDRNECPRCRKVGLVRTETVIKASDAMKACFCGSCGFEWQTEDDGTKIRKRRSAEKPDRSRS